MQFLVKVLVSALIIAGVSEIARRSSLFAAILASLPLTSILALTWLFLDTRDTKPVGDLAGSIFWAVLPSLLFFLILPLLLRGGMKFTPAMLISSAVTAAAYGIYVVVLSRFGIPLIKT